MSSLAITISESRRRTVVDVIQTWGEELILAGYIYSRVDKRKVWSNDYFFEKQIDVVVDALSLRQKKSFMIVVCATSEGV